MRAEVRVLRLFYDSFLTGNAGNSAVQWVEVVVSTNAAVCLILEAEQNRAWVATISGDSKAERLNRP